MSSSEIIFDVSESPEGGYEARALGFAIFTQADTLDELRAMVQDAVRCHFDDEVGGLPSVIRLHASQHLQSICRQAGQLGR
jgi:hypothetical protein